MVSVMTSRRLASRAIALGLACILFIAEAAAADIKVMISGGFSAAYHELIPGFEQATGDHVETATGPSMGQTPNAIPVRLARGEPADVLIMVGSALADLIAEGKVVPGSRVDLARSFIGVAVRAGALKPDISSAEAFRHALLAAKSIAYSDSASGVYVSTEMFQRLGIVDEMKGKARMIPAEPVGAVVARGEAEIGLQQVSELLPVAGIDCVGPLPPEIQKVTVFAAGVASGAKEPAAAKLLIQYLSSPAAFATIKKTGLMPPAAEEQK
jgi:molybdate transport system substrate-binding protein